MHVKRQILHALRVALAEAFASALVDLDRLDPVPAGRCPAILLRESDSGEGITKVTAEGIQRRDLPVSVSMCVARATGYGDEADALGLQVEQLLAGGSQPDLTTDLEGLCCFGIALRGSRLFMSGEGETAIAVLMHTWIFSYAVDPAQPDVAIT
ncbi:hypothetical protein [Pseudorhodoferax sp. Leaf274]|uniref:hypothetical protein n=1 Tax=Pseudorhodoferax sp. Leaf274 TaxID=1736318 RepID=UPI000702D51F|nr:hypothetical protein [Pseudorhodoferax sp. Leaf274]KQP39676.1 hypothetical protein ASF44_08060 [Pseudorhodoferax sp. Leaf274]